MSRPCTKTSWNVSRRVDRPFQSLIYLYFGTLFLVVSFVRRWYSRGRCRGVEPNDRTAYTDRTPQRLGASQGAGSSGPHLGRKESCQLGASHSPSCLERETVA